ncbi:MAG: ATP-binding protein [Albidovulum sp.]|nr:ATP-binding protein [Albidovulum sp.]
MLESLTVKTFKSLENVTVHLGIVNVFIGPNGSGKSNFLEALGILAASANGRVDDQALLSRGVRPGLPALYRTAFPGRNGSRMPPHIFFGGAGKAEKYEVSLQNSLKNPAPAWRFKSELWEVEGEKIVGRSSQQATKSDPYRGLAALKAAESTSPNGHYLLEKLQNYVIYTPATEVLRGAAPETQPRDPLGLFGGNLPRATMELLRQRSRDKRSEKIYKDVLELIDWAKSFGTTSSDRMLLYPTAASSNQVVRFRDRFIREKRNELSVYDVSEGALFALFLAVLSGHHRSPCLCSVDNADHGLNPGMARALVEKLSEWYLTADVERQLLLTTHNPLILDGLPLEDDRVRLFTVSRTRSGRTSIRRIEITDRLLKKAEQGWSLSRLWVMGHLGGMPDP